MDFFGGLQRRKTAAFTSRCQNAVPTVLRSTQNAWRPVAVLRQRVCCDPLASRRRCPYNQSDLYGFKAQRFMTSARSVTQWIGQLSSDLPDSLR